MNRKIVILLIIMCICGALLLTGCSVLPQQEEKKSGIAMDTTVSLYASGSEAKAAVEEGFQKIHEIDLLANMMNPDSDVSKINNAAGKSFVQVDPQVYEMIKYSVLYSQKTNGKFDISVGPISNLWQIGTPNQHIPSPEDIKNTLPKVNYKNIKLRPEDHSVMLMQPGMAIDLGSVAKGYCVDQIVKIYQKHHIKSGLINMGSSSMYAIGMNSKGNPWSIGIKHPRSDTEGEYLGIEKITDKALSTAGDYERYFIQDGKRYHLIFDPQTGVPAETGIMSDTIVIDGSVEHCGMITDILSTAIFVLGPKDGIAFINSIKGADCEITGKDGSIYTTKGFKNNFSDLNPQFHFAETE